MRGDALPVIVVASSGCWLWTRGTNTKGYPLAMRAGKNHMVHRDYCEAFNGPIPAGYQVDHLCRVTRCVNPAHMEAVTPAENNRRSSSPSALNMLKVNCPYGHPLVSSNRYRVCVECRHAKRRRPEHRERDRQRCRAKRLRRKIEALDKGEEGI